MGIVRSSGKPIRQVANDLGDMRLDLRVTGYDGTRSTGVSGKVSSPMSGNGSASLSGVVPGCGRGRELLTRTRWLSNTPIDQWYNVSAVRSVQLRSVAG